MRRSARESREDVVIQYFNEDPLGNVEIKTMQLTVPMNTGQFAVAAMCKGFAEHFVPMVDGEGAAKDLTAYADKTLRMFHRIMQAIHEPEDMSRCGTKAPTE